MKSKVFFEIHWLHWLGAHMLAPTCLTWGPHEGHDMIEVHGVPMLGMLGSTYGPLTNATSGASATIASNATKCNQMQLKQPNTTNAAKCNQIRPMQQMQSNTINRQLAPWPNNPRRPSCEHEYGRSMRVLRHPLIHLFLSPHPWLKLAPRYLHPLAKTTT